MLLSAHRVAKMRKVLQNGMSFANERDCTCDIFARPLLFYIRICIILSVSLKIILGDFFYAKVKKGFIV